MKWSKWIRQFHRWVSMVFTATVIVDFIAIGLGYYQDESALWVFYLPLPPLGLQLLSGLYLFVLPYAIKWRSRRTVQEV